MRSLRKALAWSASSLSASIFVLIAFSHLTRWDSLCLVTNIPLWIFISIGIGLILIAKLTRYQHLYLALFSLYSALALWKVEEIHGIFRLGSQAAQAGQPANLKGVRPFRLITLNCASQIDLSLQQVADYRPDAVCLQEVTRPDRVYQLAQQLYGNDATVHFSQHCAIVSKGKILKIQPFQKQRALAIQLLTTDDKVLNIICLHLSSASTRLDFWNANAWREHQKVRQNHLQELQVILATAKSIGMNFEQEATIIAGDFNAPAHDAVYDLLSNDFKDSFSQAGYGWPNTYPSRNPVLRIDRIFSNSKLQAGRSSTLSIPSSDHRALISDFSWE